MSLHDEMLALAPKLRAYAWMLTRRDSDADDLVQETYMRAWQFRRTFRPGSNLKAWMFRILRNAHLASVGGELKTGPELDLVTSPHLTQAADQEMRVQFGELLSALAELPDHGREALLLVVGAGLTYEEAAQTCGCSIGTIKSRISRARTRLLDLFTADFAA